MSHLAPQSNDEGFDSIRVAWIDGTIEMFGELASGYCAARLMCEVVEKAEFQWRQPLRLAINGRRHPARIELEATDFDDCRRASSSTPYESADAREKLAHVIKE